MRHELLNRTVPENREQTYIPAVGSIYVVLNYNNAYDTDSSQYNMFLAYYGNAHIFTGRFKYGFRIKSLKNKKL